MLVNKLEFSVAEAAALLNCSSQTIYSLIHSKNLFAYKYQEHLAWRIPEQAILDYMNAKCRHHARQSSPGNVPQTLYPV